jgi:hypothetical protein
MKAKSPQWGRRCNRNSSCTRHRPLAWLLFGLMQTIGPVIFVSGALIGAFTMILYCRFRVGLATNLLLLLLLLSVYFYSSHSSHEKVF